MDTARPLSINELETTSYRKITEAALKYLAGENTNCVAVEKESDSEWIDAKSAHSNDSDWDEKSLKSHRNKGVDLMLLKDNPLVSRNLPTKTTLEFASNFKRRYGFGSVSCDLVENESKSCMQHQYMHAATPHHLVNKATLSLFDHDNFSNLAHTSSHKYDEPICEYLANSNLQNVSSTEIFNAKNITCPLPGKSRDLTMPVPSKGQNLETCVPWASPKFDFLKTGNSLSPNAMDVNEQATLHGIEMLTRTIDKRLDDVQTQLERARIVPAEPFQLPNLNQRPMDLNFQKSPQMAKSFDDFEIGKVEINPRHEMLKPEVPELQNDEFGLGMDPYASENGALRFSSQDSLGHLSVSAIANQSNTWFPEKEDSLMEKSTLMHKDYLVDISRVRSEDASSTTYVSEVGLYDSYTPGDNVKERNECLFSRGEQEYDFLKPISCQGDLVHSGLCESRQSIDGASISEPLVGADCNAKSQIPPDFGGIEQNWITMMRCNDWLAKKCQGLKRMQADYVNLANPVDRHLKM
ncbi:hypothetical protein BdWA1_003062 [Babesia duncani]|uniref:Uncharacterized protein n=1 Tax=Babesia duncani TaxID=323732 RepID=A0AAD9UN38_9APIC|nr:hypothetical protein BdWA1_003062 [Babesia duncani]